MQRLQSLNEALTIRINTFFALGADADESQIEIEYQAINFVIKKYGKVFENILKGTEINPSC